MIYEQCDVAITHNKNESIAVKEGLKLIKAEEMFKETDIVLITPNWVNGAKPDPTSGVVVGPNTLRTIIQWVKERKPKRIIVGTGSGGGDTFEIMKKVGYEEIIKSEGVELIDFNSGPYEELEIGHKIIHKLKVNKVIKEMTKLISFTQLKQHEESTMSASIKNIMMSVPSTEEHGTPKKDTGIHDDLHGFIAKMALHIPIHLCIVSANPAMVGTGPTNGAAVHTGIVLCGNNPISTDTIGARLLGFKPQAIRYLYELEQAKVKETDIKKINLKGLSLKEAEELFSKQVYGLKVSVDSK